MTDSQTLLDQSQALGEAEPAPRLNATQVEELRHPPLSETLGFVPGKPVQYRSLASEVISLGAEDPELAWTAGVMSSATRLLSFVPDPGYDIRNAESSVLCAAGLPPMGTAIEVQDGWELTGEWAYVSGAVYADWLLLSARCGETVRFFVVDPAQVTVMPDWDTDVLARTRTDRVVAKRVRVPRERSFDRAAWAMGENPRAVWWPEGQKPGTVTGLLTFITPAIGTAKGLLDAVVDDLLQQGTPDQASQIALVDATAKVSLAEQTARRLAAAIDEWPNADKDDVAAYERDALYGCRMLRQIANQTESLLGMSAHMRSSGLRKTIATVRLILSHKLLSPNNAAPRLFESLRTEH